jgi:hypothetical protein
MNIPGTGLGNWTWRFDPSQLEAGMASGLASLAETYGRVPPVEDVERERDPYDYSAKDTEHPLHV